MLDCFDALLSVGHSLIVVEHNLQMMKTADYLIDLGPGAADEGGRVVAKGTPEMVSRTPESITGRFLAEVLGRDGEKRQRSNAGWPGAMSTLAVDVASSIHAPMLERNVWPGQYPANRITHHPMGWSWLVRKNQTGGCVTISTGAICGV